MVAEDGDVAVAAYLPEWRYEGANWDVICSHVSHLIFFSLEIGRPGSKAIVAMERMPRMELLEEAKTAARRHGTRLLVSFGGSGRSNGFSTMVRSDRLRGGFVRSVSKLLERYGMDGIDYNWDGISSEEDYAGFERLLEDTKNALAPLEKAVTLAYHPGGREEAFLRSSRASQHVDLMHAMVYDLHSKNGQHSSIEDAKAALVRADRKVTLGLPFYGRAPGRWTSYEDILLSNPSLRPGQDNIDDLYFNGVETIEKKVGLSIDSGAAGVAIWEVGQDCRVAPVTHDFTTHPATCPHANASLLLAITRAILRKGKRRVAYSRSRGRRDDELR